MRGSGISCLLADRNSWVNTAGRSLPLQWLADPDHHLVRYRSLEGRKIPVFYFDHYEGHQLWGFSAEMTLALLRALEFME
jgi:hypothetical protein